VIGPEAALRAISAALSRQIRLALTDVDDTVIS